jgi:hypothetical protein
MSQTDLPVLEQACRNCVTISTGELTSKEMAHLLGGWPQWHPLMLQSYASGVRTEYNRLMRLKKSKKRWRAA